MISHKNEWINNGTNENPNSIITNLSSRTINNEDYKILTNGLNHGIAISSKWNDILASSEALLDQLEWNKCLKEIFRSIQRARNAICSMSFSLLDKDSKQLAKDKGKITIELR